MKMKPQIVPLLVGLFTSCTNTSFEEDIVSFIEKDCSGKTECRLCIDSLTNFKWDTMYYFRDYVSPTEVDLALNNSTIKWKEFTRKIVFKSDDKVVYYSEELSDMEGVDENEIIFDVVDSLGYGKYAIANCCFMIESKGSDGAKYYLLKGTQ